MVDLTSKQINELNGEKRTIIVKKGDIYSGEIVFEPKDNNTLWLRVHNCAEGSLEMIKREDIKEIREYISPKRINYDLSNNSRNLTYSIPKSLQKKLDF